MQKLERAGFRNVLNVEGGFDAWQSAGSAHLRGTNKKRAAFGEGVHKERPAQAPDGEKY